MALQTHNATDELVKNKSLVMGELDKFGIFQNLQIIPCLYM